MGFVASDNLLVVDCRFGRFPVFVRGPVGDSTRRLVHGLEPDAPFCPSLDCVLLVLLILPGMLCLVHYCVTETTWLGTFSGPRNGVCFPCPGLVMADCRQPLVGMGFDPLGWGKRAYPVQVNQVSGFMLKKGWPVPLLLSGPNGWFPLPVFLSFARMNLSGMLKTKKADIHLYFFVCRDFKFGAGLFEGWSPAGGSWRFWRCWGMKGSILEPSGWKNVQRRILFPTIKV